MLNREDFLREFEESGSVILRGVLSADFIQQAREEIHKAIDLEAQYHGTRDHRDFGMVLLCALYGGAFWTLFDNVKSSSPLAAPGMFDRVLEIPDAGARVEAHLFNATKAA